MLKIGWGTKIAILYIGFVLLIGTMVTMCFNQKIDLVSDDYYDKELVFQNRINEMNNSNSLTENIKHQVDQKGVQLNFPKQFENEKISGEILFFRPSDNKKDFKVSIELNDNSQQFISRNSLSKGMYKMQISWKTANKNYYNEETIVIP
jgi:hypothetical protein